MPKQIDITIRNIARTVVDRDEVRLWLNDIGVSEDYQLPDDGAVTSPALLIALAAKRCYKSFEVGHLNPNITKVRTDFTEYLDNVIKSGHGSVLEHSVYTFAIEGVSRVFTAEMNRHRAGWAISEGSLRYIRFGDCIPFWMPTCFVVQPGDDEDLKHRKVRSQRLMHEAFEHQETIYRELVEVWDMDAGHHNFHYKKVITSALRRIVGLGVATGGVWSGNIRALRHVISMRCDSATAEEEIFHVFSRIGQIMLEKEPMLFGDFTRSDSGTLRPANWKV